MRFRPLSLALCGVVSLATVAQDAVEDTKDGTEDGLPLVGETESLNLSVTEGSWLSLDITPDGSSIIFEILGDVYRLPMAGGTATPVLTGLGYDSMPTISPDGSMIAFVSDRDGDDNLWVANIDGTEPRKLSSLTYHRVVSPTWTPEGDYVGVFQSGEGSGFRLYHVAGGGGIDLAPEKDADFDPAGGGAFSSDGRYFFFSQAVGRYGDLPRRQVARFDRETGETVVLTESYGGALRPVLSPDDTLLVYATRFEAQTGLRVLNLETGDDRWLAYPIQRDSQENRAPNSRDDLPRYDFTPDGSQLVLNYGGAIKTIDINDGDVGEIPFSAELSLDVGPDLTSPYTLDDGPVEATILHDPARLSPGGRIVMSAFARLYATDGDAANPKRLTEGTMGEFAPSLSPDGRWVAYVTWQHGEGGHIWKVRANGRGRPEQLTQNPAYYNDVIWSKDGESLYATRGNGWRRDQLFSEFGGLDHPLEIVRIDADGGDAVAITPPGPLKAPHWGPEDDRLYAYDGDALVSLRLDGSDLKQHLKVTAPRGNRLGSDAPPTAELVKIAPQGGRALAMVNDLLYLVPVTRIGAEIPTIAVRSPDLPVRQITDTGVNFFDWSADGQTVFWSIGSTLYSRPLDSLPWRDPEDAEEGGEDGIDGDNDETEADGSALKARLEDDEAVSAMRVVITQPRAVPEGSLLLSNLSLIAMAGDTTEAMTNRQPGMDVLITGNTIAAVGPTGSLDLPDDTTVMDMSGKIALPGFVDTHAHWEFRTQDVLEPHNWSVAANLAFGVTTGLDVQTSHKDYFTYRDLVETGQTVGQRALMTGPGIFGNNDFKDYAAVEAYLRRYSDHYRTKNIKAYLSGNREQRQWVVQASKKLGLMPTTEGGGDMRMDLTHAIDGMHGNEHTLTANPLFEDVVQLYAQTKTAYTATLLVQYNAISGTVYAFPRWRADEDEKLARFTPKNRLDRLTQRKDGWALESEFDFTGAVGCLRKIQQAGGLVGIGGHGELQGLGYHWEMWLHGIGGMTPAEILRAATIDGAKIIGVEQSIGSIEAGKRADLVVLNADPLVDIRNTTAIVHVVKDGFLYADDTLDQVWPEQKAMKSFWWWDPASRPDVP